MALATLTVDITARLGQLQQDLDKAGRMAEKNAEQIRASYARVTAVASAVGGAIAGAFAGFSIVEFVKGNAEAIDALNDVKDATGASIENISGLEQVALKTGASLSTVSDVLIKFNKGLAEGNANGPITQTLKAIGLSAEELRKLDPAEALRVTAIALSGYADDANKARIIQELFGKSVKEAAPFLHDLAEAGTLNAKITTQQAEEAEKFNKQLFELKTNSENSKRAIAAELVPALNQLFAVVKGGEGGGASPINDWIVVPLQAVTVLAANVAFVFKGVGTEIGAIAAQIGALARLDFKGFSTIGAAVTEDAKKAREELDSFERRVMSIGSVRKDANAAGGDDKESGPDIAKILARIAAEKAAEAAALQEQKRYENLIKKVRERLEVAQLELRTGEKLTESERLRLDVEAELSSVKLTEPHRAAVKAMLERAVAAGKLREQQVESAAFNEAEAKAIANYSRALAGQNLSLKEQNEELGLSVRQVEALRIARLEEAASRKEQELATLRLFSADSENYGQMQLNIDALREQIRLRKESVDKTDAIARDPTAGAKAALDEYSENVQAVGTATKDAFSSTINSAQDSLLSFFKTGSLNAGKFADEVITQILRIGVVKPLINIGAKAVGSLLGIPGFASGGDHAGGLRLVGEHGPELEATGPARIFNAADTQQILGGGRGRSGALQLTYAPVYQVDSRSDRAQVLSDIEASNRRNQGELLQFLKAKGVL